MNRPPYGNTAKPGKHSPNHIFIYCGPEAWELANRVQKDLKPRDPTSAPVLVFPSNESAFLYEWPVHGFDVTVVDTGAGEDALRELGHALLKSGATLVVLLPNLEEEIVVFRQKELSNAA